MSRTDERTALGILAATGTRVAEHPAGVGRAAVEARREPSPARCRGSVCGNSTSHSRWRSCEDPFVAVLGRLANSGRDPCGLQTVHEVRPIVSACGAGNQVVERIFIRAPVRQSVEPRIVEPLGMAERDGDRPPLFVSEGGVAIQVSSPVSGKHRAVRQVDRASDYLYRDQRRPMTR